MIIGLCIAGYLSTVLIALFVFAYVDKTHEPGAQVGDCICAVLALLWPVVLLILLVWTVVDIPLCLADWYARKHNLKKKEAQS